MQVHGIKWATIVVRDIDEAADRFSKLLGTTFRKSANSNVGAVVAISEEVGLELVSPLPGYDNPVVKRMGDIIERFGGGPFSLMFSVDNADEAAAHASEMGLTANWIAIDWEEMAELFPGRVFKTHKHFTLNPSDTCGALIGFDETELE